jgi:ABC-type antimicrobial peptide transport system permease subunit
MILVAGHPPPKFRRAIGRVVGPRQRAVPAGSRRLAAARPFLHRADNETTAPVAIVNESFVRRFFKSDEDPLGQHFGLNEPANVGTFRIVGVVRDAKFAGFALRRPARPMFYVPLAQNVDYTTEVMRRIELQSHFIGGLMLVTGMSPGALEPVVTKALSEVDPNLTLTSVRTLQQQVALSFDQDRAVASLAGLFGVVSLVLAAIGLYGVTAYAVAQRTNEIGLRMALGAGRRDIVNLVLRGAFTRVGAGLLLGIPLAIGAGRLIAAQLYGVSFWDPLALAVAAGSLGLCALVAALVPAGRAASIPPMFALRAE